MTSRSSVIVPTAFRPQLLVRFIGSLNAQTELPFELVVVDGQPSEEYEHAFRAALRPEIPLRYVRSPLGLTRQRNKGIDAASGELVFFFDDDVVLEPRYLAAARAVFDAPSNESIGAVSGMITNAGAALPPRTLLARAHAHALTALRHAFFLPRAGDGRFLPSGMPTFLVDRTTETDCECLFGACMAFRRSIVNELRFDERLSRYCYMEDDDIAQRVSRRARIRYTPHARCAHLHQGGNRMAAFESAKMLIVNHHYLFRKNFPKDPVHRAAHALSLFGYPLLMASARDLRRFTGAAAGLLSIALRRDQLSALEQP